MPCRPRRDVSIHAPAWGATGIPPCSRCHRLFQSTRPRGARLRRCWRDWRLTEVSIHAPAWGATRRWAKRSGRVPSFNPRARVGRDGAPTVTTVASFLFQSTRPRGARRACTSGLRSPCMFQSTRPRGARLSPNWTNTNYSTKQSYIQVTTRLTKITRPAVPQFRCQGTRANIPANRHHLPFARHRARQ